MKLIVGLGNPGRTYAHNRHNIGFRCLNYFAKLQSIRFERRQCRARIGIGEIAGSRLLLAKPHTFVNLSGKAVACLTSKYNIPSSDLLVICDDLDLPLGKIRLRPSGGSNDFPRIRVGIGRPTLPEGAANTDEDAIVNYVLSDLSPQEEKVIKPAISTVAEAVACFLNQGIETAMSKFN
jgi:PTH1 family peptidyl-tRNA hydrolase